MTAHMRAVCFLSAILFLQITGYAQCTIFPVVNLGADTTVCDTTLLLDAGNPGMTYQWSTSATTQQELVNASGIYSVIVTDSAGCSGTDTIAVTFNPPSVAGIISLIGGDTILCGNEYTIFYMSAHSGYVLWWVIDTTNGAWVPFSGGDTLDFDYAPNNITGNYVIIATVTNGTCPPDTSNLLTVSLHTSPEVDLGPDTTMCDSSYYLSANIFGSFDYLWSNGDTMPYTYVYGAGIYWCTMTTQEGCADTDSVTISVATPPIVSWFSPVDTVCVDDAPFLLTGGNPAGGIFSGQISIVNGNMFDPHFGMGWEYVGYGWQDTVTGCSGSASGAIYVDLCVGIPEEEQVSSIVVYPNPANDKVTVTLSSTDETVEIVDAQGRVVEGVFVIYNNELAVFHIENLSDGMYFIRVSGSSGVSCTPFVKQSQ